MNYKTTNCVDCNIAITYNKRGNPPKRCRPCFTQSQKEKSQSAYFKRNYGLTMEQYNEMKELQSDKCSICGNPSPNNRNLSVDHNHETGEVRGFLCIKCNTILGYCNDDIEILAKAIAYLMDSKQFQYKHWREYGVSRGWILTRDPLKQKMPADQVAAAIVRSCRRKLLSVPTQFRTE